MCHVLPIDALPTTHAIDSAIKPGNEADAFDAISFSKAASVLRMLREHVGHKEFQSAISNYLTTVSYFEPLHILLNKFSTHTKQPSQAIYGTK